MDWVGGRRKKLGGKGGSGEERPIRGRWGEPNIFGTPAVRGGKKRHKGGEEWDNGEEGLDMEILKGSVGRWGGKWGK